ncbi:MAG: DUF58 domain-containing protein [Arachidicoccus sp.]|nr:DUF58 domain-containing protein [Arachidicoccus sp.]
MPGKVHIRKTFKHAFFFTPVTLYFLLFFIGATFCYFWLKQVPKHPGTPFHDIFVLLLKITLYAAYTLLLFGFLSVLTALLFFIYKIKKRSVHFHIAAKDFDSPYQPVEIVLYPILRPILGYIKLRFIYDDGNSSEKIQLVEKHYSDWYNKTLEGFYDWKIEDIKEFRISSVMVYFEDFLQFFSFVYPIKTSERFYTPPQNIKVKKTSAHIRNTENRKERIDEMRKVEGELFNYKKFDANDDVRRIVWKIYAKNKDLMIRSPETLEPYASHLYLYVSFYTIINSEGNELLEHTLLNFYKNKAWNVYQSLSSQNVDVRWVSDQSEKSVSFSPHPSEERNIKHLIALSNWQTQKDILNFVQTKNASVVLVSSLTDVKQIQQLQEKFSHDISFLFVPLSKSFSRSSLIKKIKLLFIKEDNYQQISLKYFWETLRVKRLIMQNEKALKKFLKIVE